MGIDPIVDPVPDPPEDESSSKRLSNNDESYHEKTRIETNLRFEFTTLATGRPVNIAAVMKKTIGMMYKADHTMQIKPKNGNNGDIEKMSDFPTTNAEFKNYFEVYERKWSKGSNISIGFKVHLSTDIENLKHQNHHELMNYLLDNNLWLKKHAVSSLDMTRIGFQYNKHPVTTNRPELVKRITHHIKQQHPNANVPVFEIRNGRPQIPSYNGKKYSMNALVIFCSTNEASNLSTLMMKTKFPRGECGTFSPLRVKDKTILPRIALAQNAFEQKVKTVVMVGVHADCLYGKIRPDEHLMDENNAADQETMAEFLLKQVDSEGNPLILSIERTTRTDSYGRWLIVCDGTAHQEQVETFLTNNLSDIYARSLNSPEVDPTFGNPAVSGGDVRSVAATYVSELTDLPELCSDEEQSTISARAPKRSKGRAAMIQADSNAYYAAKSRSSWAGVVSGGEATQQGPTQEVTGNKRNHEQSAGKTEKAAGAKNISTGGQQTKQDIALANRFESHKRTVDQQVAELNKQMEAMKKQLQEQKVQMEEQKTLLQTFLKKSQLDDERWTQNTITQDETNANVRLLLQHLRIVPPAQVQETQPTAESPVRKRSNANTTPPRQGSTSSQQPESSMDTSLVNNSFSALAEEDDEDEYDATMDDAYEAATQPEVGLDPQGSQE